jgi:hypothetical protein
LSIQNFSFTLDISIFLNYNIKVITVTETVARIKAQREAAFGASRKQVVLGEDHSRVADAKGQ